MDQAIKQYLLYGSPLKTSKGRTGFYIVLAVLLALAVSGILSKDRGEVFERLIWTIYPIAGSLITFLIVTFLNKKRAVRWFHLGTVAAVALVMTYIAALINNHSPIKLVTVGFNEELAKIVPALLLFIYVPGLIRTKKDGIVFGALCGIGFNITEMTGYFLQTLGDGHTWVEAIALHSTRLALLGFGSHIIWSAFCGMGLGMTAESRKNGFRRWLPFIICYLVVAFAHSLYDLGGVALTMIASAYVIGAITGKPVELENIAVEQYKFGTLRWGMISAHFVYNIVLIVILLRALFKSAAAETEIYKTELSDESSDVITEKERSLVAEEGRWRMRRYAGLEKNVSKRLVRLQNYLAIQKHVLKKQGRPVDDCEVVSSLRAAIAGLRAS